MPRFCRSLWVRTSMLMGTSCRFSSRLRAVTRTSCSPPLEASADAANAGVRGAATLASAAATARPILELGGEMSPVAHARAVQRLTHLFGAGGAHRALGFMKREAGRFERKSAVREQAADVRLGIPHKLLVLQVQHLAGQHAIPVIHERQIAMVIAAQIPEVVAERLSLREVLLEGAEA